MTIDEAVRVLAEKISPNPAWDYQSYGTTVSKCGFWESRWSSNGVQEVLRPVSPLESAEFSERLLDAMPSPHLQHLLTGPPAKKQTLEWFCAATVVTTVEMYECDQHDYPDGYVHHENRRMAIFLAALKWQGIEEPTI